MNIQEFKAANPAYADVPDLDLADALHKKFYSEIPKDQFLSQVGLGKPAPEVSPGAGGGRGVVNPPIASEPQPQREDVGAAFGIYPSAMGSKRGLVQEKKKTSVLEGVQMPETQVTPETQARTDAMVEKGKKVLADQAAFVAGENRTERSATDYLKDIGLSTTKITPTVVKNLSDITNLLTLGQAGFGDVSQYIGQALQRIENKYGSKAAQEERKAFGYLMASDAGPGDIAKFMASNPLLAADMGITTAGSMAVPIGAVGVAGKVFGKLGPQSATAVANTANVLMNAGDTFTQTEGDVGQKLLAAGIAGAGSAVAGKLTGGGLEGQIGRQMAGRNAGLVGARSVLGEVGKEAGQEFGESASQSIGQDVGEFRAPDVEKAIREGTVGAVLSPIASGPISALNATANAQRPTDLGDALAFALESGQTVPPGAPSNVRQPEVPTPTPLPAAAHIAAIGKAESVDEAIASAQLAVSAPTSSDIAAQIADLEAKLNPPAVGPATAALEAEQIAPIVETPPVVEQPTQEVIAEVPQPAVQMQTPQAVEQVAPTGVEANVQNEPARIGTEAQAAPAQAPEAAGGNVAVPVEGLAGAGAAPVESAGVGDKRTASWVIKEKGTGNVVMETFDKAKVDALNTEKYEAIPILDHLVGLNRAIKKADAGLTAPVTNPKLIPVSKRGAQAPVAQAAPTNLKATPVSEVQPPVVQPAPVNPKLVPASQRVPASKTVVDQAAKNPKLIPVSQRKAPDTPEFKRWFGDSKVVDAEGKPLVVYHGTTADFSVFDAAKIKRDAGGSGFYFTTDREQRGYAEGDDANVMPVYLSIQNPTDNPSLFRTDDSYDGLIFPLKSTPGVTHIAVRRPEQIKSATGNIGTFDPSNPDIRFSKTGRPTPKNRYEAVTGFVDDLKEGWANAPEIVVVNNMQDKAVPQRVREADELQKSNGATGEPDGFFYGGKVYIVADEMKSPEDVARVLFHETLGHYGLRGAFGDALTPVLQNVARLRPDLMKAKAKQYGIDIALPTDGTPITDEMREDVELGRMYVAEEVLAELAQTKPESSLVRRAIAAIRTWLRENIPGFDSLKLSDDEMIRNYILPARGWVERGEAASMRGEELAFARSDDRDLIVTHNLTTANLLHAKKMGGIPVPSLAVTRKSTPLSGFGEITLVGNKNLADPKGYAKTKVFGADIYSPRYPSVELDLDPKAQKALIKKIEPMAESMGVDLPDTTDLERDAFRSLKNNIAFMAQFLEDQGIKPAIVPKESSLNEARVARLERFGLGGFLNATSIYDLLDNPDFVKGAAEELADAYRSTGDDRMAKRADRLLADPAAMENVARDLGYKIVANAKEKSSAPADKYKTQEAILKQIQDSGLTQKFDSYVQSSIAGITKSERIPQGFSASGKKKYIPHTLENVVKILKKELRGGESFNYGVGSLRSKFTPEFKTISDIKKEKGRLISAEDFDLVKEQVNKDFIDLAESIGTKEETLQSLIEDAVSKGVPQSAKFYDLSLSDDQAKQVAEFMVRLRNLPTAYFEAKVLRPVEVSEFSGAVVPSDLSPEALSYLKSQGIENIESYERNNEEDRKNALAALTDRMDDLSGGNTYFSRSGGWNAPADTRTDKLIYNLQDGRVDLKRVQEAIEKAGGDIEENFNARMAETLYAGRVAKRSEDFLKVEVKPLLESMAKNNVSMDELSDYLLARHAPERNEQIAKVNPAMPDGGAGSNSKGDLMTTQAANDYIANLSPARRALMITLAKKVDALTQGTRDLLVGEGLEKAETVDAWTSAYKHYVPLFKDEAEAGTPHPQGSGFSVKGSSSKRAMGSKKQVTNMLAHVLMQREAAITRAEKNRVGLSLYGLALSEPNSNFWTTIRPQMSDADIEQSLTAMGVDPAAIAGMERAPTIMTINKSTGQVQSTPNPMYKNRPNALVLKVGGEDRVILFNEGDERAMRLAENLKNLDGLTSLDLAGSVIGKATRFMASMATQYNPAFGFVNLVRDTQGALVNLSSTELAGKQVAVLADVPSAIKGIARDIRGGARTPWSDLYQQFQDDGGQTGYKEMWRTADDRAKAIQKELDQLAKAGKLTPGKAAHAVLDLLDGFNTTLENAVRLSAYKQGMDQGMSRPAAAKLARELTVDFNRKGRAAREISPLYAFFNAALQGTARTVQTLKGPAGAKIIAGGLGLGVLQAFMLATAGYDDEDVPEFVKSRALVIPMYPFNAKKYISIPLPLGLHVLPNTGRVLAELSMSKGKDIGKKSFDALGEIAGSFNPLGGGNIFTTHGLLTTMAPTVVDPLIDLATNTNFAGNKISRETFAGDKRPGYMLGKEGTARMATGQVYTGIAQGINWVMSGGDNMKRGVGDISPTPEQVRYIIGTIGGGLYREVEKTLNVAQAMANDEPVKSSQIPLGGRFYGEVDEAQVNKSKFFKAMDKISDVKSQMKVAENARDAEAFRRILAENPQEVALMKSFGKVQQSLSDLNKLAMESVGDREKLKQIDTARDQLIAQTVGIMKQMEEAQKK